MGWETLAIAGFSALNAVNTMKQGTSAAKAAAQEGTYEAQQSADNTVRAGGKLTTSFLNSGLTLEGGPSVVLAQAFAKGQTDIGRIANNANTTAKNDINSARSKALAGLASAAGTASLGSSLMSGLGNVATDVGNGFTSLSNGTGFGFGYDVSQDFRAAGGGFGPGEFK